MAHTIVHGRALYGKKIYMMEIQEKWFKATIVSLFLHIFSMSIVSFSWQPFFSLSGISSCFITFISMLTCNMDTLDGLQVQPKRYMSDLSSSCKGSLSRVDEGQTFSMSNRQRSTRGEKIRRKFNRCVEFFIIKRGS